jgi:hypothetical protein
VEVGEPGDDELARGVDPVIRGPGVIATDVGDAVIVVDETAATQESVSSVVAGNHVPAVDDRSQWRLSSTPASTAGLGVSRNDNGQKWITGRSSPLSVERVPHCHESLHRPREDIAPLRIVGHLASAVTLVRILL